MREILGVKVEGTTYGEVAEKCLAWAKHDESRAVLFANVHMLMEAFDDPELRASLNAADIVNPDGMPLVWSLRAMGEQHATRVYGPDATLVLLRAAEKAELPVAFYGGTDLALTALVSKVQYLYPRLKIVFTMSPPFRHLSGAEDDEVTTRISASGARMLFVGMGCPKQERWIMVHRDRIPAVMFGVGAAFDFIAGTKPQAPRWMMRSGLEWMFRLASEPRRLASRYFKNNPRFVLLLLQQLMSSRASAT